MLKNLITLIQEQIFRILVCVCVLNGRTSSHARIIIVLLSRMNRFDDLKSNHFIISVAKRCAKAVNERKKERMKKKNC